MFNFEDTRYNRQEQMPEWGKERQEKLKEAKVAVIGAGGVKSTFLMALVAGGIGNIRIIEFDTIELSNLNRQVLYRTDDIGRTKGQAALTTLTRLNPDINIELIEEKISENNIDNLLKDWDFIVEGGESPAGRNLVNEYCLQHKKPFTHASAQFSYGYAFSVVPKEKSACFACFFPEDHTRPEHTGAVPVNVLSTSLAGSIGAAEVFKWFLGYQDRMLTNKRLCFSSLLLSGEFTVEQQSRREDCPVCSIHYNN
ncbi:ThiF family adenylyltransferase [Cohnella sp. LGH]|uniref:HesA/MoeB/ThiF family protein n=1 Tax=Cohnella sp. LGH TaxID=1619153 RepID=UPI001ADD3193|nr:ThiF family adenylyltransferase [Cohnella sp. LGH]QTH41192.1 ThiF family adenylyltransferase [Cohnella sp. LGH]